MTKIVSISLALLVCGTASAQDIGERWWQAFQKGKGMAAAAVTVKKDLAYGVEGKDSTIKTKVDRHLVRVLKKLRKPFKKAEFTKSSCTAVGREMGYMSQEWKDKKPAVAEWIRSIPNAFCKGTSIKPPQVWLIKVMGEELPHAILLWYTGENELINGFYHF